jgi:hypothetical protein
MLKRKWKNLISVLAGIIILSSCTYDVIVPEKTPPAPPGPPGPPAQVSYSTEIQPIFDNNCTGCHGAGQVPPNLTSGKSYASLFALDLVDTVTPDQSKLYIKITGSGSMAKYCPPADAALILKWIEQGAKNN